MSDKKKETISNQAALREACIACLKRIDETLQGKERERCRIFSSAYESRNLPLIFNVVANSLEA